MRKIRHKSLVFIAASLIVALGYSKDCVLNVGSGIKHLITDRNINDFKGKIDYASSELLSYHDQMMDINSIKENLLGTKIIVKDDTVVVKSKDDYLTGVTKDLVTAEQMSEVVDRIESIKRISEENGAEFLYAFVPSKESCKDLPENVIDNSSLNSELFLSITKESSIPFLDYTDLLNNTDNAFFYTDHHWTPRTGFKAAALLCEELHNRYGFEYDVQKTDISNFDIQVLKNYFLGSYGKKTGTYFSWHGADDIEIISPTFETDFIEEQPYKDEIKSGSFSETLLFKKNIEPKDYYRKNAYATYSGGDFRLQIFKNNLLKDGKKILMIRDSSACVVAPFLALNCGELHIADIRNYSYFVGDKLDIKEYIKTNKPDYVVMLYTSIYNVDNAAGRFDF